MQSPVRNRYSSEPGAVALLRKCDGTTWFGSTGLASLEHAVPLRANTVMNVGSVAKQVTARLVLFASQEGNLRLDTAIKDLLPLMHIDGVTVLDLIRHRGGVRDAESMLSLAAMRDLDHYTSRDLLRLASRQRCRATPPDVFLYSNTGYLILAEILRETYGQELQDIAADRIFKPLGMSSAIFKADPRTVVPNAAGSYRTDADGAWISETRPVALDGPGSLWCSVFDLDRWATFVRSEWCKNGALELPYADRIPYAPSDRVPYLYGPGLYANVKAGDSTVFHFGHEHGFSAAIYIMRGGTSVICLSNRADLLADRIAGFVLQQLDSDNLDFEDVVADTLRPSPAHLPATFDKSDEGRVGLQETTDDYICDDAPGVLRLIRTSEGFHLQRRGYRDRLIQTDPVDSTYAGPGYRIRDLTTAAGQLPSAFILDMDRAPGLRYARRTQPHR